MPAKQQELDAMYGIVRQKGRCGGAPTIGESRLTCSAVLGFAAEAYDVAAIIRMYPELQPHEVVNVIAWGLKTPKRWR
jgi:uncharacterized protein (DUF433 family)